MWKAILRIRLTRRSRSLWKPAPQWWEIASGNISSALARNLSATSPTAANARLYRAGISSREKQRMHHCRGYCMDHRVTRRDFLGSTLLASGAALLDGLTPAQLLARSEE